jgi:glycosyltransferase involved in cell wall biosynthesis
MKPANRPNQPILLYNGWSLVFSPNSFEAIHLLTLLECKPEGCQIALALPGKTIHSLPTWVETLELPSQETETAKLWWEQWRFPRLAKKAGASLIHLTSTAIPLWGAIPVIVSPVCLSANLLPSSQPGRARQPGTPYPLITRIQDSLADGGYTRVHRLLWPGDLPVPTGQPRVEILPPSVHPQFFQQVEAAGLFSSLSEGLPDSFVLYHADGLLSDLPVLLETWAWVVSAVGSDFHLLLAGFSGRLRPQVEKMIGEFAVLDSVNMLPELTMPELAFAYQNCTCLIALRAISAWGNPLRSALACGKPVAAPDGSYNDNIVGPAAYLVPVSEAGEKFRRALAAAILTILVEDGVSEQLSQSALQRSCHWSPDVFSAGLGRLYRDLLGFERFSG